MDKRRPRLANAYMGQRVIIETPPREYPKVRGYTGTVSGIYHARNERDTLYEIRLYDGGTVKVKARSLQPAREERMM